MMFGSLVTWQSIHVASLDHLFVRELVFLVPEGAFEIVIILHSRQAFEGIGLVVTVLAGKR